IGYLFGQYKRLTNKFEGVLTGKGVNWGGSLIRPEATGYGCVYFASEMLGTQGAEFKGKRVAISGSGNVAQFAAEKVLDLGGVPVTLSDSSGFIFDGDGITREKLDFVMKLKNERRGRIHEYCDQYKSAKYHETQPGEKSNPLWETKCDVALPCATQNEINEHDASHLVKSGCKAVAEGANMPSTPEAIAVFEESSLLFAPGKAANAGGVAVSGLEMTQNAMRLSWTRKEVDDRLRHIMHSIHAQCRDTAEQYGSPGSYINGANIAGFLKVANAMLDQGVV
ncbi:MAG: NADP-specific glutamate dehydrogenase, partial [Phycisphaerales bacterium]|nr:NADP-specific glutamate dehydrogenase [Phycisphaerales bacterium]